MEQRNNKKIFTILAIVLISCLFILGIVFTLIKNDRAKDAERYNQSQSQIEDYLKDLPED
jgi:hypothetical protein